MTEEITELDNKYLVLKWDDINSLDWDLDICPFNDVLDAIKENRKEEGKSDNKYLVLNLDDEIDMLELRYRLFQDGFYAKTQRVKDIAVDLVNAVLKVKQER